MPPGDSYRAHPPHESTRHGSGGLPLRVIAWLMIAPAVLALVVLGGSVLASSRTSPETVVAGVALLLVIVSALFAARALLTSLTRLRDSALTAANRVLPERLERLRDPRGLGERTPEEFVRDAADPVGVPGHDELGQVAYAVNTMYREALLSGARQAVLRGEVNAMVFSLARRSQTLVDKMAGVLAEIEHAETDPSRLTRLFELDRLVTRMRRNDENMLILAGVDSAPPHPDYLLLTELVEQARREVEQHSRVDPGTVDNDVAIAAYAAGDVVRLIAELIDNATRFSPPTAPVLVDGRRIGDYVLIEIEDRGLGMPPSQLAAHNERLANPPAADVSDCRMMGLAVVARLAERHQIRVTLRANSGSGTVVSVTLPTALLVLPNWRGPRELPRRPVQELPSAAPPGWPLLTGRPAGAGSAPAELPSGPGALPPHSHALPAGSSARPADGTARPTDRTTRPADETVTRRGAGGPDPLGFDPLGPLARRTGGPLELTGAAPTGQRPDAPVAGDGDEPVIFKEMQARWFGVPKSPPGTAVPAAGEDGAAAMARADGAAADGAAADGSAGPAGAGRPAKGTESTGLGNGRPGRRPGSIPGPRSPVGVGAGRQAAPGRSGREGSAEHMDDEYGWRSAGDDGWRAAVAAASPRIAGVTGAGLPRRTPAAQLVPGAVAAEPASGRRDPDEVRGVLSAYHRGVQRGRDGSDAQSPGHPRSAEEERH